MATIQRTQELQSHTGDKRKIIALSIVGAFGLIAILLIIIGLSKSYKPPKFEANATTGIPAPEEGYLYGTIETDYGYSFALAANLYQQEDQSLNIYFTNPSRNDIYLMCEVIDKQSEKTLYKSGLVQPGEYVASLTPQNEFSNVAIPVTVKIYAFEKDTWYSAGSSIIDGILQAW